MIQARKRFLRVGRARTGGSSCDDVRMTPRQGLLLAMGVVAVSFSALFIREAHANGLVIAFYRNAISAAVVLPAALVWRRDELRRLSRRQVGLAVASGAILAAHFALWIPSVKLTTIAASVTLVTASPIFVAAGARVLFRERVNRTTMAGILVGLVGAAVISGGDFAASARAVAGDLLALGGAAAAAAYFLVGRHLRQDLSLLAYVGIAYPACALFLLPVALLSGGPISGFDATTWWMFVLMAAVPQGLGHTTFNYLLKEIDATIVSISVLGEPVGSTVLAMLFLGEVPPWTAVAGGVLVLAGIYVAITGPSRARRAEEAVAPLE
jgi:drug/metabolite transporter (DMT)-like permease